MLGERKRDADRDEVIGVVGPLDSSCAAVMIPVLNSARNDGIPIVSPSTSYPCLTHGGAGCDITEPDRYYPSKKAELPPRGRAATRTRARRSPNSRSRSVLAASTSSTTARRTGEQSRPASAGQRGRWGLRVVGFGAWDPPSRATERCSSESGRDDPTS